MLLLAPVRVAAASPAAPPFTFSLDQTVPCPAAAQDYSVADVAIDPDAPALRDALAPVPAMLDAKLGQLACPAASVIVTQGGRVVYRSYRGSAKLHGDAPLRDDTGYKIASITKTFTAAMLFKLRDDGKLPHGLDTPVAALLPGFAVRSPFRSARGITLRSLAMHASGMPRELPSCPSCTEAEILKVIGGLTVLSPQFAQTHYSNLGIAVLGRAIEKAAGKTWEEYVAQDILAPLGMNDSGNPPWDPAVRARMAEGSSGGKVAYLPNTTSWTSPCGSMHSSPRDMVTWMNFLMDAGSAAQRARWAAVLDPATRIEMHRTGIAQPDAISGVSSGVLETAFIHNRRTVNKLGCDSGYRSDITMVPDLGLGIFGVATSTCDLYGDGDALAFPVASAVIPAVEALLLAADRGAGALPNATFTAAISGQYCTADASAATRIGVETITPPGGGGGEGAGGGNYSALVLRAPGHGYSFVLRYLGGNAFRRIMGPEEFLPADWPACHDDAAPGQNLCPISCGRKMARGSGDYVYFEVDQAPGEYHGKMHMFGATSCHKYAE